MLDLIDTGHSPILITADGKPDLLMFSWSDYKRRFSILYPLGELERVEDYSTSAVLRKIDDLNIDTKNEESVNV